MGHLSHQKAYLDLRRRMRQTPLGFPDVPAAEEVLRLLFRPEEAEVVARLPLVPMTARRIARRLGRPECEVVPLLDGMAERGLIIDLHDDGERAGGGGRSGEGGGRVGRVQRTWYCIAPPVVGFFEFSLMRRRSDVDQGALARAYERLFDEGPAGWPDLMKGETPIGRTLVHEGALQPPDLAEMLTWERASAVVAEAGAWSLSLCYCRHKQEHLGRSCTAPMDICMALGSGARYVVRHGLGRAADRAEALDVIARARDAGLVQIADNVRNRPTWICNCCGCCCLQLQAINRHGVLNAIRTSPFLATVDVQTCRGCGRCARRCPIQAITLRAGRVTPGRDGTPRGAGGGGRVGRTDDAGGPADPRPTGAKAASPAARKSRLHAEVDEAICLGCGLCERECRHDALRMAAREPRLVTPEGTLERILVQAFERGKLQHLLFDDQEGVPLLVLNRLAGAVLRMTPVRRSLLSRRLRSRFIGFLASGARRTGGDATQSIEG